MRKPSAEGREQRSRLRSRRRAGRLRVILLLCVTFAMLGFAGYELYRTVYPDANVTEQAITALNATAAPSPTPRLTPLPTPEPTATPEPTRIPYTPEPTAYQPVIDDVEAEHNTAVLRITGDIMCSEPMLNFALNAGDKIDRYDFTQMFDLIRGPLQNADYTIGNLETTIGRYNSKPYSGYPRFNSPETLLEALKGAGYDCLTLANNHMLDRWLTGVTNTVNNVEAYGFDHAGAYTSSADRNTPTVVDINGIRVGLIPYTQMTNGMEGECDAGAKTYAVPWLLTSDLESDVTRARAAGAQVIIAFPHWGTEYRTEPDSVQSAYAVKLAQAGVDIIIGSHPHVMQKISMQSIDIGNGRTRPVLIAYSMGNFLSTQTEHAYTDSGMILQITLVSNADGSIDFSDVAYLPTYCWQHNDMLQVVPVTQYLDHAPDGMSQSTYEHMLETYEHATQLLGAYTVLTD